MIAGEKSGCFSVATAGVVQMQRYFDSIPLENPWKIINTFYRWKQRYRSRFAQVFIENLWAQLFLVHRHGQGDRLTSLNDPHGLRLVGSASVDGDEVVHNMNGDRGGALLRQDTGNVVPVHQRACDQLLTLQVEGDLFELKYSLNLGNIKVTRAYLTVLVGLKLIQVDFMLMSHVLNTRAGLHFSNDRHNAQS